MDCMDESTTASTARHRAHQIITGKHKRSCSSFGMVQTVSSSSYSSGGGEGNNTGHGDGDGGGGCMISYYTNDHCQSSEEEEDMANCLIMLAQSVSPVKSGLSSYQKTEKLENLGLAETADTASGGKSDFHNYECKTCNRAFPSFQALGGHRASHKRPKLSVEDRNSVSIKTEFSDEDQPELLLEFEEENKIITINNKPPSPPIAGSIQTGCNRKFHECSICGSKFLSGQALGGHMRRHRPAPPPSTNQIAVSTNNIIEKSPVLSLDLNLPAPEVVDDLNLNFQFSASSSQRSLVFSAPALIDCHY